MVHSRGGRVVKFLGDAAMFVAAQADDVAEIATCITEGAAPVRGGIAYGDVLAQDGDYFGPPVNLAARLVAEAGPRQVLGSAELVARLDRDAYAAGPREPLLLRGYEVPVEAFCVERLSAPRPAGA